jgi:hypothetical protein
MFGATARAMSAIAPLRAAYLGEAFAFVINGTSVPSPVSAAAALSPAVSLQLSVDSCARRFIFNESEVNSDAISFFERLLSDPSAYNLIDRRLTVLFKGLWNPSLEEACFFTEPLACAPALADSISLLSVDALDVILSDCRDWAGNADYFFS